MFENKSGFIVSLLYTLILSVFLSLFSFPQANLVQTTTLPTSGYFLAPDAAGILQVWRLSRGGNAAIQTDAKSNIQGFAVSPDEQQLAYFSDGQLWLQKSNAGAEVIVDSVQEEYFLTPSFNPAGTQIAYTDGGIWVLNLDDGTSKQVLADEPLNDPFGSTLRYYVGQYLDNDMLYVNYFDFGPYESAALPALLDLTTGRLALDDQPAPYAGLSMTPLSDGRLLFSSTSRIGMGMPGLVLVDGDLSSPQILLADEPRLKETADSSIIMPIVHAFEPQPGHIRFIGERILPTFNYELFDYDLAAGTLEVDTNVLKPILLWSFIQISPDGKLVAGLENFDWQAGQGGNLAIFELATGKQLDLDAPGSVRSFQWHITST